MRSTGRSSRTVAAAAGAALLLGGLAACGGNADASEHGTVTVMTWAPEEGAVGSQAGMPALAAAIAKDFNATGGIGGRQVQVLTCDEHNTSAGAIACANEAVARNVVAVVGSYSQYGSDFMPLLEGADIPYLGGFGLSPEEFNSIYSYPVNGGYLTLLAGNGEQLVKAGCTRVAVVRPKSDLGDTMLGSLKAGLSTGNVSTVDVPVDSGRTEYSAAAVQAIGSDDNGSCVTTALDPASTATFFDDYRRQAPRHTRLSSVIGSVQQSLVDSTGGATGPLQSLLATGWYPPDSSPVWNSLHALVKTYAFTDNRINTADPGEETTWIAYEVLRKVVSGMTGQITAKSLRIALDNSGPIDTGGQTPALAWGINDTLALSSAPRLVNTRVTFLGVQNGQLSEGESGLQDVRALLLKQ
ncbi:ABC transporter substrate-binding protein [Streptacidiphilus carbonis]|uniref:ABC transporter substrate-binding protein n=1 Tax=Streptacidiphilus carbonis TaxID=105422 RepID=UPI0005A89B02|nr:ABC transporter substrate-binding protein [Streptacidiphilus carbonis]